MSNFIASNGVVVLRLERGLGFANVADEEIHASAPRTVSEYGVNERKVDALREFFRAEEDERLGRWRWPENPDYVVYPDGTSRRVVKESTGQRLEVSLHDRKVMETYLDSYVGAARAFDAAHPEPKPAWHDAAFIAWKEGPAALLPHVAVRYPRGGGGRDLGWHVDLNYSGASWHSLEAMLAAIGDADVTILVPKPEDAS